MTTLWDDVYLDLVAHFYTNATQGYNSDTMKSYVKGVKIELKREVIRKILGMGLGGEKNRKDVKRIEQLKDVKRIEQLKVLYGLDVNANIQPKANTLSLELRLVTILSTPYWFLR